MSMKILVWLFAAALLAAGLWQLRRGPSASRAAEGTAAKPARFRGVRIEPGLGACAAAREIAGQSFLSAETPRLPLPACSEPSCTCRYRHHEDRRDEEDRRSPFGTLGSFGGYGGAVLEERRRRSERRGS